MTSLKDIRSTFLDYFAALDHEVVASSPLVPRNDPTLMFTNAGMVQFKNVFTGAETRAIPRAASSQKVVRAGGKHNDLDNVGYTARHHTFFEMLGNFSFGDYFKAEAIDYAWRLITKEFGLPAERLLVTVYAEDEKAAALWKSVAGLSEDKIIRIPTSDNFWAMGDTGPCGPCSEIFYDHGEHIPGGPPGSPDEDGDRFVEIWNLVFMQYEQVGPDDRRDLPKPSIDTGMGLERIAAVLQGVHSNYEIDLFRRLIDASVHHSGAAEGPHEASHRVIADHLRSTCFLIADGVLPSNEGRGYVLRRIMRRAMRHAHLIGSKDPLMHRLVPTLVSEMGGHFEELRRAEALITETLKLEESRFRQTLERGLRLLEEETTDLSAGGTLSGETAFKLYDTYGFPLDLTQDALRARDIAVDTDGFNAAMARQKAEARKAWKGSGEQATEEVWFDLRDRVGATDFLGYAAERAEAVLKAVVVGGKPVEAAEAGTDVALIFNQSPFYGESGGQIGDTGSVFTPDGAEVQITDTVKRVGDLTVHLGTVRTGTIRVEDIAELAVDAERRERIRANHSATHLLHAALRRVLGAHVTQKGSLVAPDRLRFDISHPKPIAEEEMSAVEAEVNQMIRANAPVETRIMTPEDAIKQGAMALFGEKYGEEVRVLTMGEAPGGTGPYSVELCGGTHVRRLGDIALFKVLGESAVSAGVRRIEALTGEAARQYFIERERAARTAAGALKTTPEELPDRVVSLLEERKRLERELAETKKKLALGGSGGASDPVETVAGVKLLLKAAEVSAKELRGLVDEGKRQVGSGVVAFVSTGDKPAVAVGVTDDLTDRFSAVDLLKAGLGGKGGGRPDMAQGGGPEASDPAAVFEALREALGAKGAA